ncbi:hypothetical protein H206_00702 [Candidatus Electrothrix aarhusensis]|uniref:Uncharacterized protein n=1 Tax=Candidatus Electrothrix aarhusensis TaxID=1859131 RepID=A0A444IYK5_9BACT|nr:hypothetical protein H206_00702 [Candidatus Electrothrix aarhusensis]
MKKNYILISIPALILLILLGWYFSDKQVIKRQLNELTWNLNKEKSEPTLENGLKMREIKQMLAPDVRAIVSERNYRETLAHDMLIRYLMYYRDKYETLTVSFEDLLIELPAKGEATASATVLVQRKKQQNDLEELREPVELLLRKKDKEQKGGRDWRLVEAKVSAALVE